MHMYYFIILVVGHFTFWWHLGPRGLQGPEGQQGSRVTL